VAIQSGKVMLYPADRLFDPVFRILLFVDAIGIATQSVTLGRVTLKRGDWAGCKAKQFDVEVLLPVLRPTLSAIKGSAAAGIEIGFFSPTDRLNWTAIDGNSRFIVDIIKPTYIAFFEAHRPWLEAKFGADPYGWPPLMNFARVVRDALAHNYGRIHVKHPADKPVRWQHLSYSPSDEGLLVFGDATADFDIADIIILLFEMAFELDNLDCPVHP
jgi:hypothetical protein